MADGMGASGPEDLGGSTPEIGGSGPDGTVCILICELDAAMHICTDTPNWHFMLMACLWNAIR